MALLPAHSPSLDSSTWYAKHCIRQWSEIQSVIRRNARGSRQTRGAPSSLPNSDPVRVRVRLRECNGRADSRGARQAYMGLTLFYLFVIGLLIFVSELRMELLKNTVLKPFGFMHTFIGRGLFYLFVGSLVLSSVQPQGRPLNGGALVRTTTARNTSTGSTHVCPVPEESRPSASAWWSWAPSKSSSLSSCRSADHRLPSLTKPCRRVLTPPQQPLSLP